VRTSGPGCGGGGGGGDVGFAGGVETPGPCCSSTWPAARGDHGTAARRWLDAARRYDRIGSVSDAVLATAWAARVSGAGITRPGEQLSRVRQFAERNRAPGLLALAVGAPR